jgi:hypothetical protein
VGATPWRFKSSHPHSQISRFRGPIVAQTSLGQLLVNEREHVSRALVKPRADGSQPAEPFGVIISGVQIQIVQVVVQFQPPLVAMGCAGDQPAGKR